jgi:branched-subunit amino acid transport protein
VNVWLAIALASLASYLCRVSMIVVVGRISVPGWFERVSVLVMPAAFAGLLAGAVVSSTANGARDGIALGAAAAVTALVAARRSPSLAVAAGMPALWVAHAVLGA